jgi:succinyl-diaminopimelate desuccinylase
MRCDLVDLLLDLLAIPSVTGQEGPLAGWLESRYRDETVRRLGNSVVVGPAASDRPVVLLVGHIDTVPPTEHDREARREGGRIVGRGASDMKAGIAVAMSCFEDPVLRAGPYDMVLVCYAREEGDYETNELGPLLESFPDLGRAALAVVLEPTDLTAQLGCMGTINATVVYSGRAAHSARPWQGENALTKAGRLLAGLHGRAPRDVTLDGLLYREVLTATQARTVNARNVVPDRFEVNLNYRFAPGRTLEAAEQELREVVGPDADVTVVDAAPPGEPHADAPIVRAFLDAVGAEIEPKQAWTDVARLSALGVPALNYGPGLTAQAHQAGEWVPGGEPPHRPLRSGRLSGRRAVEEAVVSEFMQGVLVGGGAVLGAVLLARWLIR